MADEIRIELIADADGVVKAVQKVVPAAEKAGKKAADNIEKPLKSTGDRLKSSFAAIGAILGTALAGKKFIEAAAIQDAAVQRLNASLRNTGSFSEETSKSLQNFASSLQSVTTFGDEVVLDQLAFAQAMGASVDQSKEIVKVAADMSAALGMDFNSAVRNISRTLGGFKGEIGEVVPELSNLTKEQLQAGGAIDVLASKFQGFATAETKTFTGAMTQLQNTLGDAAEKIGEAVVKSPVLIKAINLISQAINNTFGKFPVEPLIKDLNGFIITLAEVADAISILVQPLMVVFRTGMLIFDALKTGAQAMVLGVLSIVEGIADALPESIANRFFDVEGLKMAKETASGVMDEFMEETSSSLDTLLENNTGFSDAIRNNITEFASALHEVNRATEESINKVKEGVEESKVVIPEHLKGIIKESKQFEKEVKQSVLRGAAGAFSSGFQAMGAAVANGSDVMQAGFNALLGGFGQTLAQLGAGYFLQGATMLFVPGMAGQGGALMAKGAALSVFGGFLSAKFGGGAGSAPSVGGAGAGAADTATDPLTGASPVELVEDEEPEAIEKQQQVQVVVQGDILDNGDETATRILNLLNENFDSKGGRIAYA